MWLKMEISEKISSNRRISLPEAADLENFSLFELGRFASMRRNFADPSGSVGYISNRMINYSNICAAQCKFCAYHAGAGKIKPFRLPDDEIISLCTEAVERGAKQIMLQGGLSPEFTLEWAENLLRRIKSECPKLWLHVFSPSEIVWFARRSKTDIPAAVSRLKSAGADSVPGAADLLVPEIRRELCGNKCTVEEWRGVMRALAANSMTSSATMTFGMGESFQQRLEHLDIVRSIQDETGVFKAFICWPVSPENTQIEGKVDRVGANEFLKMLAVSRIYLDNIKYIQSGWLTEGLKVAEIALLFGSNDVGGVLMDEMVVRAAGVENKAVVSQMEKIISNAGFIPRERDGLYRTILKSV